MNALKLAACVLTLPLLAACAAGDTDADPDAQESAWDAQSVDHEEASTHLWIVNRAVDVLAKHAATDPTAKRMAALMNDPTCRTQWQQGLLDADFKAEFNNGVRDLPLNPNDIQVAASKATWESHFFDPDTGKNYKGATSPTAYTEANAHLGKAIDGRLSAKEPHACYELGLALHYYTDLTQSMHATNFTALDRPAKLHSNLEGYATEIQDRYPIADWTGAPTGTTEAYVMQTARDSKPLFMEGVTAIVKAYKAYTGWHILSCRNIDADPWRFVERQHVDYRHCWEGNPDVDAVVGKSLESAQDHTAKYLYLVGKEMTAR